MVAGIDVIMFRPDEELRRLARLAVDTGVASAFSDGRPPAEIDAELATSDAGRAWLDELEKVKDPWFHMGTGDGLYHYFRSWLDDPTIPYASIGGHISALQQGRDIERPTAELARERDRLAEGYAEVLADEQRGPFQELLTLSRTVFPYVEEHKFYCDYWFLTSWYNKVREFGALLAAARLPRGLRGRLPALAPRGHAGARGARAALGVRRHRARPDALAADRRAPPGAAGEARRLDAAAGARRRCPRRRPTTRSP